MRRFLIFIFALLFLCSSAEAKVYVAEPYLIDQSAYSGAEFYVYRPYNMPKDWFITFDGYAVTKTKDNVWVYGTIQGGSPVPTNYIVGTVRPSLAGIIPYYGGGEISSTVGTPYVAKQPIGPAPNAQARQVYMPDWAMNPKFMNIGNWRASVDRIGILQPINLPVAWKGEYPKVILVWGGENWHQLNVGESDSFTHTIKLALYQLTKQKSKTRFVWYREDTALLTEKAINWGYYWMGEITVR